MGIHAQGRHNNVVCVCVEPHRDATIRHSLFLVFACRTQLMVCVLYSTVDQMCCIPVSLRPSVCIWGWEWVHQCVSVSVPCVCVSVHLCDVRQSLCQIHTL